MRVTALLPTYLKRGTGTIRILVVNEQTADRTWFVAEKSKNYIVCGPLYVDEFHKKDSDITIKTEIPWTGKQSDSIWIYDGKK